MAEFMVRIAGRSTKGLRPSVLCDVISVMAELMVRIAGRSTKGLRSLTDFTAAPVHNVDT